MFLPSSDQSSNVLVCCLSCCFAMKTGYQNSLRNGLDLLSNHATSIAGASAVVIYILITTIMK